MITHRFRSILGPIPNEWGVAPLRELLQLSDCTAGDWGDDEGEAPVSVIRSTNFTNDGHFDSRDIAVRFFPEAKASNFHLVSGDILVEKSGGSDVQPVGRVIQVSADWGSSWFSNFIQLLRPDPKKVNPRYLFWVLYEIHASGVVERMQNQTTQMRNLELRDYLCARIPVPGREEQDRICRIVDATDAKVVTTKELLGISGSLRRDSMQGPLNTLKTSLLQTLILGSFRSVS